MIRQSRRPRRRVMVHLILSGAVVFGPSSVVASATELTNAELADGWIQLFDGETLFGWQHGSAADWQVADGAIRVTSGDPGLLCTTSPFGDFVLRVDFRADRQTNSGIFLRTTRQPKDPARDCYELNIAAPEWTPFPTGSFVGRQKGEPSRESSDWRTYEVTTVGGHFRVWLDGQQVLDYTDPSPLPRGHIGLQLNRGKVEFRNVKLKPLSLAPIFNGRDLNGWHVFPGKKSEFSVTREGELHVTNGNGQLESEGQYADFVLQCEVFSNGRHLNSGIFFRSIRGEFWQGYESQIHNGFHGTDRANPIDFGTGGFYRRQKARRVVADDFQWFHKTLVVAEDHMATWVNGYQVSDWTDTRAANPNPREGLRREAGTILIQGHDPSTDLRFRNFRVAELPKVR